MSSHCGWMSAVRRRGPLALLGLGLCATLAVRADEQAPDVSGLSLPGGPVTSEAVPLKVVVDSGLADATGEVQVVVQTLDTPLVVAHGEHFKQYGGRMTRDQQREHVRRSRESLEALVGEIRGMGGRELGRVNKALVAAAVAVDASKIDAIAKLPNVRSIRRVRDYQLDLTETVPYIGAKAVQAAGIDGSGVKVAVLDSGIDYTHSKLGGSGSVADYLACYATNSTIGDCPFYPNSKVIGGYDFVGETWPNGSLAPDPDPIAMAGSGFHGTHVADIIAGLESTPGAGDVGVAPGASLYAVKVCSAVSSSCSGVALLQGMDFALDPNGDGDISDAVDVVNMSLGSAYGQKEDDLGEASANAVHAGVVVVASAGNNGDRPYIVGSPSSTPEVISVAQTQVPSALNFGMQINSPASIAGVYRNTSAVDWAPVGSGFTGDVAYVGRGCPGSPGDPYLANPAGKVALIDRGVCSVSLKVDRAAKAGAIGVLIGLVAPGDAVSFSYGGGDTFVPTLVITQADSSKIKANINAPVNVTVSPATAMSLVGGMVSSSARGPSYSYNAIKPDIGAPGASVSAEAGTGTGKTAFGGTSGAAPMVSGSVALLIQKYPWRTPFEIKSLLMNTAETNIQTDPALLPGSLAPITRIGGGEVRVNRAFLSSTAAWEAHGRAGSLSFGYQALTESRSSGKEDRSHDGDGGRTDSSLEKEVVVRNYSNRWRTYSITPSFRYADDEASGAVTLKAPRSITVGPRETRTFEVKLKIDPSKLPVWTLNGGSRGGDGFRLQGVEFDGYITIADARDNVHLAWQVLPHRAADVEVGSRHGGGRDGDDCDGVDLDNGAGSLRLTNEDGTIDGRVEVFALTGTSPKVPRNLLPHPGDNFAVIDLKSVGVRQVGTALQFAINTFGERSHPNYPAEYDVYIDADRDGTPDYVVFNAENGGFGATGQNVVAVYDFSTSTVYYYTDADLDSANAILTVPLAAVGLSPTTKFDFSVYAFDNYFTGTLTDSVENMTHTLGTPRFSASAQTTSVPAGGHGELTVQAVPGGDVASPSQTGLLLLFRDAKQGKEAAAVSIKP